jgi:hypothetical protein
MGFNLRLYIALELTSEFIFVVDELSLEILTLSNFVVDHFVETNVLF